MDNEHLHNPHLSKKRLRISLWYPLIFLFIIWVVKLYEHAFEVDFYQWGINPRKWQGLIGIFTSPLLHSDFEHLFNNSVPMFVLIWALFYFYKGLSFKIFVYIYLLTGLLVWISGRSSYHIGASGVLYGLAAFLFFSGIFRKYIPLMAIALVVAFLYGSLVWGVFPYRLDMSYEAHFWGGLVGFALAILYKNEGPQRPVYSWELEEDEEVEAENGETENDNENDRNDTSLKINYHFKPDNKE